MGRVKRTAVVALAAALSLRAGSAPAATDVAIPPTLAPLFDASADRVVARIEVPSKLQRVGEVRLIRRGGTDVVQTLLYSKILVRAVAEIRNKEMANWPPQSDGRADAERYVAALEQVQQALWEEIPKNDRRADRRQWMIIEFATDATRSAIVVGEFRMDESADPPRITERHPRVVLEPSRAYACRNMRMIAADSFKLEGVALDELLAPLEQLHAACEPHGE
jgi:hypothetical protein